ncbi:acyltransferase family protein [Sphaerisporangium sp. TRM90804]|uniref:acyltransferase family protein n=1 Tax=Sphaerisporangium sp. TRM90804 TaxID=3031113 RepID=UPI0024472035|nr:acyltransferase family protein [Sphaerisporangium sp. TRM90804]MDH2423864.1 acyltransferase family protein [Sphaerisporangium sp. TRM90804]
MLSAHLRTASPPAPPGEPGARLAWLDAIRGIGSTAVLLEHMLYRFLPGLRPHWFHLGMYGVIVFFLVSGYIIPASLEHRGDVRAFWVGRLFRLYPLYLLVVVLVLLMTPVVPLRRAVAPDLATVAAHATMLVDVVGAAGIADTMWTLSYEMIFYLLVTALYVSGTHRRSGLWAAGFAVAAFGVGLVLAAPALERGPAALVSFAVMTAGLACVVFGSGRVRTAGALAAGVLAVVLVLIGGRTPWLGPAILAIMFAGTALYRWERGQASALWVVAVVAATLAVIPFFAFPSDWWAYPRQWITTLALAGATFAAGMLLRHRRMPGVLVWLGVISYSVYLMHNPMLKLYLALFGDPRRWPLPVQGALAVAFITVVLFVSWLTYRYVECPARRLGRRLTRPAATPG